MANKKISDLQRLVTVPANTAQLDFLAVDSSGLTPATKRVAFSTMYDYIDDVGLSAFTKANDAYALANSALYFAESTLSVANTATETALRTNSVFALANATTNTVIVVGQYANNALNLAIVSNANSLIMISDAPINNKGIDGHKKGMVHLGTEFLYYCTSDYTTGSANIWSRIATTSTW